MFIGRSLEIKHLEQIWDHKKASFIVIKGRRRIGKSTLAKEFGKGARFFAFSGMTPTPGVTAQMQRREFAHQLARNFNVLVPNDSNWGDLFWHLAQQTQNKKTVILLDEISWMGMDDPSFLGALKTAWDLHFKNNKQLAMIICGSVSTWIEENILNSTGFVGRIDLAIDLKELGLSDCVDFWGKQGQQISAYEKLKVLSVTGGVPRYLEFITPTETADEFIRKNCFTPQGFLFREFDTIFHDLFQRRSDIYIKILKGLVNESSYDLDRLLQDLDIKKSGVYHGYMADLESSGFVRSHRPWNLKDGKTSRLTQFRISDNYTRFYLKYIAPNKEKIQRGFFHDRSITTLPAYDTIMGLQFENLVINHEHALLKELKIVKDEIINAGSYFQKQRIAQVGCQIDYMVQLRFNTLYVCEVKFSRRPIEIDVIDEMRAKIAALNVSKSMSIRPVLVHVNGVDDAVIGEEYFSNIIDFADLLKK